MKLPLVSIALFYSIALTGCSSSQAQPNAEAPTNRESIPVTVASSPNSEPESTTPNISKTSIDSYSGYQCTSTTNHLFLGNGTTKNKYGNPIYTMHLCVDGKEIRSYEIVTGRNFTQQKNRNRSGTHSPLPNGKYRMSSNLTQGMLAEVGRVDGLSVSQPFLPISPLFGTGRSALGIHVDPSYNIDPKEDGTSGCIGLTTTGDFKALWADIKRYQIRNLQVAINTTAANNPDVAERQ